jgi:hypothetical protein
MRPPRRSDDVDVAPTAFAAAVASVWGAQTWFCL